MPASERFENYEVLRREDGSLFELGRGGMGVTYKARDLDLHCDVALKVINPSILGNPDACERFLREARAAARLRHPNIASVFRLGKAADETHFYAMEFCEGPTLHQAVAARGPFRAAEAVRIAWQVCKALLVAEQHRVVHRDLKPANLILTESRDEGTVVKVIDFGLAKSFAPGKQTLATMGTNGFVGTAHFASPEQLEEHELDIRSDIYSLGVCLWFMLDGQPPFTGSLARVMSQMLSSDPPWDRLAAQPARVVQLLRGMLAKNPKDRPATAAELRREIEECIRALESPVPRTEIPRGPVAASRALEEWKFATRYPMSEEVGRDVLGRIFRGVDASKGGATVAVRVIDAALVAAPATRRDLEAQIAAARAHPHPHLVTLLEYAFSSHGLCVATEWLEGFSLLELLKRRGALAPDEVVRLLAPLAEAADHAARYGLCGPHLSKQQVQVHFPGGLSREERERVLAAPVEKWPSHVVKADVLSLGENGGAPSGTRHSMMTLVPGSRSNGAGARASIPALASLANELLGAPGGPFSVPIARLSEAGNAVLRRASTEEHAFPTAATFVLALGATIGKDSSASPPRTPKPQPSSSPSSHPRLRALAGIALLFLAFVGACFGYYYGIHQPREHARQEREMKSRETGGTLSQNAPVADEEPERRKADAEKAKTKGVPEEPGIRSQLAQSPPLAIPQATPVASTTPQPSPLRSSGHTEWTVIKVEGRDHVSLDNLADFYGLGSVRQVDKEFLISTGVRSLRGAEGSVEFFINGLKFNLSYPIVRSGGALLVSRMDLTKLIEPVLRPQRIQGAEKVDTIVLDAAHGGHDKGAYSQYGWEKDFTLDVVGRARLLLQQTGYRVALTRSSDTFIPDSDRVRCANQYKTALFISIHFNSGGPEATGLETYTLAPRGVPSMLADGPRMSDLDPWPGHAHDAGNMALATAMHAAMVVRSRMFDRGIKRARFVVLRAIDFPGVLVEGGFLSNIYDAKLIATPSYRQQMASCILQAVENYRRAVGTQAGGEMVIKIENDRK